MRFGGGGGIKGCVVVSVRERAEKRAAELPRVS